MQYTIRNLPDILDKASSPTARERGKNLNEVAIEALTRGVGVTGERVRQRDLSDIAGTWSKDPAFDSTRDVDHLRTRLIAELGARAACTRTLTFDQKAGRLPGTELV